MQILKEMNGSRLMSVSSTSATYVGAESGDTSLTVIGLSLVFDSGIMTIENRHMVRASDGGEVSVSALVGHTIDRVEEYENEKIEILFEDRSAIIIFLRDEDWRSPEAASYAPNKGHIVVIN